MTRFSSGLSAPAGGTGTPQLPPWADSSVSAGQTAAGTSLPVASPAPLFPARSCPNCPTDLDECRFCDGCGKVVKA